MKKVRKYKNTEPAIYKTLYIKKSLINEIDKISNELNIPFNKVVISIIEDILNKNDVS